MTYTSKTDKTGADSDQEFNAETYKNAEYGWRILGVSKGKLRLISGEFVGAGNYTNGSRTYYTLKGQKGYINGIEELNKISAIFGHGKGAEKATSIMNTLTNVSSVDLAKDMFNDLTEDSEKTQLIKPTDLADKVDVRKVPDENTEEYSTDTFMFSSKDFDDISDLRESVRKSSTFIKILIVLVVLIVLAGAGFIVYNFFIK